LYNNDFDIIRAASVVQLQLNPDTTTVAPESSTRTEPSNVEPAPAAAAAEPSGLENQHPRSWPLKQMQRSPTCRLPNFDKTKPKLVAENKSKPLMPLLLMAQVSAYLPAASYRVLGTIY
jgi:hypothetical protein